MVQGEFRRIYCRPPSKIVYQILTIDPRNPWACVEFDRHKVKSSDYLKILSVRMTNHRKQTDTSHQCYLQENEL